jgi:hypothetical protein
MMSKRITDDYPDDYYMANYGSPTLTVPIIRKL